MSLSKSSKSHSNFRFDAHLSPLYGPHLQKYDSFSSFIKNGSVLP